MSAGSEDRTLVVRVWMEERELEGEASELRAALRVAGQDGRIVTRGLQPTRVAADQLLVSMAAEMGCEPEADSEAS